MNESRADAGQVHEANEVENEDNEIDTLMQRLIEEDQALMTYQDQEQVTGTSDDYYVNPNNDTGELPTELQDDESAREGNDTYAHTVATEEDRDHENNDDDSDSAKRKRDDNGTIIDDDSAPGKLRRITTTMCWGGHALEHMQRQLRDSDSVEDAPRGRRVENQRVVNAGSGNTRDGENATVRTGVT